MSMASLEREILAELKQITGNSKLTKNSIQEWSTTPVKAQEGELLAELPKLHVFVAYKLPVKK